MTRTVSLWIRVNGKFAHPSYQDSKQTRLKPQDGEYYLRYAGKWEAVGTDPLLALDAKAAKEKLLRDVERGVVPVAEALPHLSSQQPSPPTVAAAIAEYLADVKLTHKPRSYSAYNTALAYFLESCPKVNLEDVDRRDLLKFSAFLRDEKEQAPRTVYNKFEHVMTFLKARGIRGLAGKKDWPRYTEEEPEIYEREELDTLFGVCDGEERLWYEFFLMTGMREQEVMHTYWSDVNFAMLVTGEQNSGKSTLWERFMWLLEGTEYKSGALPSKERSFVAAITNNAIQIFDNIDSVNFNNPRSDYPGSIDLMCKCSTGGSIPIAQLYETNVEKRYDLRCDLFFTARVNPFPSDRSDLARRTLTFPIRNLEPHEYITVEKMKRDLMADREEILLETLIRLCNILRGMIANAGKEYEPITQMHSYEEWTMRIADHEGWAEEMRAIWRATWEITKNESPRTARS